MAEPAAEGEEIFEINDYTFASPWEKFVGAIEDVFVKWGLHADAKGQVVLQAQQDRKNTLTEVVPFLGEHYCLTYFIPLLEDEVVEKEANVESHQMPDYFPAAVKMALNRIYDWPTRAHPLSRWYGITSFVVLAYTSSGAKADIDMSRCSQLLSSLCLAASHVKSSMPIFVPLTEKGQHVAYLGYCSSGGTTVTFKSTLYPASSLANSSVPKIVDIYRNKLGVFKGGMLLSTRYTYVRRAWPDDQWRKNILPHNLLRWGPESDPLQGIGLGLAWSFHSKDHNFPTLTPQWPYDIPTWYLACSLVENPQCQFTDGVREVFRSQLEARGFTSVDQLQHLGTYFLGAYLPMYLPASESPSIAESLQSPRLPSPAELDRILRNLFKDTAAGEIPEDNYLFVTELHGAPVGSLFGQAAIELFNLHGLRGMTQLWFLFTKTVRTYWAQGKILPRLPSDKIDLRCCLVYQKLQMARNSSVARLMADLQLNYCTKRRRKLAAQQEKEKEKAKQSNASSESDAKAGELDLSSGMLREGALEQVNNLSMLSSGLPVWAPEVQEYGVMTEDMVAEQLELLTRLGSDTAGAEMRARMQIGSLESDMQAFKAANPGCTLEDFVRWYSPRDWIESTAANESSNAMGVTDSSGGAETPAAVAPPPSTTTESGVPLTSVFAVAKPSKGSLSKRMQEPGNLWAQTWAAAKPVPVSRQKQLFQIDVEAEKALHYLETVSPTELISQILRVVFNTALFQFSTADFGSLPTSKEAVSYLASKMMELFRYQHIWDGADEFVLSSYKVEAILAQLATLHTKFEGRAHLFMDLYRQNEAYLDVSPDDRKVILKLFAEADGIPQPEMKEFIVRSVVPRPVPTSRAVGNRMYVILNEPASEYRISTMLSLDE